MSAPKFPAFMDLTVFVHFQAQESDLGTNKFSISIRDQDGKALEALTAPGKKSPVKIEGHIRFEKKPGAIDVGKPNLINFVTGIGFLAERPGNYSVWLEINGQTEQLPLTLSQLA